MEKQKYLVPFVNIVNIEDFNELLLEKFVLHKILEATEKEYHVEIPNDPEFALMQKVDEGTVFFVLEDE